MMEGDPLGDPRSWSDDPAPYEEACKARGVVPLPDPEIDFPDWLEDQRGRWDGLPAADGSETSPNGAAKPPETGGREHSEAGPDG